MERAALRPRRERSAFGGSAARPSQGRHCATRGRSEQAAPPMRDQYAHRLKAAAKRPEAPDSALASHASRVPGIGEGVKANGALAMATWMSRTSTTLCGPRGWPVDHACRDRCAERAPTRSRALGKQEHQTQIRIPPEPHGGHSPSSGPRGAWRLARPRGRSGIDRRSAASEQGALECRVRRPMLQPARSTREASPINRTEPTWTNRRKPSRRGHSNSLTMPRSLSSSSAVSPG